MNDTRTIAIGTKDEGIRHFNVDNVAYLRVMEVEPTTLSVALYMGIPLIMGAITFVMASLVLAGVVAVILFFIITAVLSVVDSTEIGTLNDSYELDMDAVTDLEDQFRHASQELLTVEGTRKDAYNIYEYRYHLVPDNIVSISYKDGGTIPVPYIFYGLALFFGAPVASTESSIIGITGFIVFLAAGVVSSAYRRPDKIIVDFQNNESKAFRMSQTDRRRLLNEFATREASQSAVQARAVDIDSE